MWTKPARMLLRKKKCISRTYARFSTRLKGRRTLRKPTGGWEVSRAHDRGENDVQGCKISRSDYHTALFTILHTEGLSLDSTNLTMREDNSTLVLIIYESRQKEHSMFKIGTTDASKSPAACSLIGNGACQRHPWVSESGGRRFESCKGQLYLLPYFF